MASKNICTTCLRAIRQRDSHPLALNRLPLAQTQHQRRTYAKIQPPHPIDNVEGPAVPRSQPQSISDPRVRATIAAATKGIAGPYVAYGSTEDLFLECSRQCGYVMPSALASPPTEPQVNAAGEHLGEGTGFWLTPKSKGGLGLDVTFQSWAQVLYLHMWMLTVRFRCFPKEFVKDWHQQLLDHFFYAAEDRMATWHGMSARGVRNKNLKEQWLIWRGVQLSYDEGIIKGDAEMGAAIWRNIFKSDPEVDVSDVALVTAYVMRELQSLSKLPDHEVTQGKVKFGDAKTLTSALAIESRLMKQPVTKAEIEEMQAAVKE